MRIVGATYRTSLTHKPTMPSRIWLQHIVDKLLFLLAIGSDVYQYFALSFPLKSISPMLLHNQ